MLTNTKLFVWKKPKSKYYTKLVVFTTLIISCNLIAAATYSAFHSAKAQVLGVVSGKDGYKLRYSKTTNGALTFTGNSLCLSDARPQGTCATFISTDQSLQDSGYGNGTTNDWSKNSSVATVKLPQDSEVLYAELIWGGSYKNPSIDLTDKLDKQITLKTPKGNYNISPESSTSAQVTESSAYVRTANVTNILAKDGAGSYTVGGVPATMDRTNPYNNYAGWTLAIAYRDIKQPPRNLSIFVGSEQVGADQISNIAEVKGFATPTYGKVYGRLLVSAQEGDPCYSGDEMRFGSSTSNLKTLSGPNNSKSNFFASQINGDDGKINNSGSFGSNNQPVSSCSNNRRQGWDITNVDISSLLTTNQTAAYAQGTSQGDAYMINGLGMQIDVNAAKPEVQLQVDKTEAKVGDTLTYTMQVKNNGTTQSINTELNGLIPSGTSFVADSLKVDNQVNPANTSKVNLGTINPGQTVNITYQVKVDSIPSTQKFVNQAEVKYQYNMVVGEQPISDSTKSNEVITLYNENPNKPPVAQDDSSTTTKNTMVTIDVLKNDSDLEGNLEPNSLSVTQNPKNGNFVVVNGKVNYTPNNDFVGTDTFKYSVCDSKNLCDEATVSIIVKAKPEAENDTASTLKNTPVEISILNNDIFQSSNNNPPNITTVTNPTNGSVSYNPQGKAIYTPNLDYTGNDKFEYQICDLTELCDTAIVTINITAPAPINNPPIAVDDQKTTDFNTPATINVINNDSDPDNNLNPESITIQTQPTNGTVSITPNGLVYTPNNNYSGSDSFEYKVCDTVQACDLALVSVTINAQPQPDPDPIPDPTPQPGTIKAEDDTASTKTNKPVSTKVILNDTSSTPLNLSKLKVLVQPTNGTAVTNNDGTITYTPNLDYQGKDVLTYQICNQEGLCSEAKLNLTVIKETVIELPKLNLPVPKDDEASTTANSRVTISVSSNDIAPNSSLNLNSIKITKNASNATLIVEPNTGNVNYIPNPNFVGNDMFIYEICNTQNPAQCATAVVRVTVTDPSLNGGGTSITPGQGQQPTPVDAQSSATTPQPNPQGQVSGESEQTPVQYPINSQIIDKQSEIDEQPKRKGQVLGAFDAVELIRTGGSDYITKIMLPLNIALIGLIFALNRIADKKDQNIKQVS